MKFKFIFFILSIITVLSCKEDDPTFDGFTVDVKVNPENAGSIEYEAANFFPDGTILPMIALANDEFYFQQWTGDANESKAFLELLIDGNKSLVANFGPVTDILNDNIVQYIDRKIDKNGLVFMIENGQKKCFLINKKGNIVKQWDFDTRLGNDIQILADGRLLGIFKDVNAPFSFGGGGGIIKIINLDGTVAWEYIIANDTEISHHDIEMLPNGNILTMVWEKITPTEADAGGVIVSHDIFPEKIVEINPSTDQIVWQWRAWEHIVQDQNAGKANFGVLLENPRKINILHSNLANGDWFHANAISYDAKKDVIYMSVNFYSEVWVIDHSTTTQQAASSTGGAYGKGGDLLYRFGNPEVFGNMTTPRIFYNNHNPSIIPDGFDGEGNLIIYNNGSNNQQSIVMELSLPNFSNDVLTNYVGPSEVWSFSNPDLYFDRISGAVRLPNGNTQICEGDYGYWEVTKEKEVVWKYDGQGLSFWRGYYYEFDSDQLKSLNLGF